MTLDKGGSDTGIRSRFEMWSVTGRKDHGNGQSGELGRSRGVEPMATATTRICTRASAQKAHVLEMADEELQQQFAG